MELILDPFATDDPSLVGECSHIVAEKPTGTRGDSPLTAKQRNRYRNLILLCNVHHKQVDDQPTHFTVERLHEMKRAHESWVRTQLAGFDVQKQEDDERWAGYIEEWSARSDLNNWLVNTSHLLSSDPQVDAHFFAALKEIPVWVLSRVWPNSAPDLRAALENYSSVVNDLLNEFAKHSKPDSSGEMVETIRFYRIEDYNEERYHRLLKQFNFHVDLLHDLVFELTRAGNLVCDIVRREIDSTFRIEEGVLLVQRQGGLTWHTHRLEYQGSERMETPYPGVDDFIRIRSARDAFISDSLKP